MAQLPLPRVSLLPADVKRTDHQPVYRTNVPMVACVQGRDFGQTMTKKGCEELNSTILCVSEHFTGNTDCIKQTLLGMVDSLPIPKEA